MGKSFCPRLPNANIVKRKAKVDDGNCLKPMQVSPWQVFLALGCPTPLWKKADSGKYLGLQYECYHIHRKTRIPISALSLWLDTQSSLEPKIPRLINEPSEFQYALDSIVSHYPSKYPQNPMLARNPILILFGKVSPGRLPCRTHSRSWHGVKFLLLVIPPFAWMANWRLTRCNIQY